MTTIDELLAGEATPKQAAEALIEDPLSFLDMSYSKMQSVPRPILQELQTEALKLRFENCRDRVPMLTRLAEKEVGSGITDSSPLS